MYQGNTYDVHYEFFRGAAKRSGVIKVAAGSVSDAEGSVVSYDDGSLVKVGLAQPTDRFTTVESVVTGDVNKLWPAGVEPQTGDIAFVVTQIRRLEATEDAIVIVKTAPAQPNT